MYLIQNPEVYILNHVFKNPDAVTRLNRMLTNIKPSSYHQISLHQLQQIAQNRHWTHGYQNRTGNYHRDANPPIIFNVFDWNSAHLSWNKFLYPTLHHALLLGQNAFTHRAAVNHLERNICQAAWEVHSIFGCLHACDYCHVENFVNIMLNIEELIQKLKEIIAQNPTQLLYKYDSYTDTPIFEPEYGGCEAMVRFFAQLPRQYLLLYTKSANVDFLLNLPHNGHTIINWSLSPDTQSRQVEKFTPPVTERIRAMKKCQDAGYRIRARFSPLMPLKNWEYEFQEMVSTLLSQVTPDVITIDVIGFMSPNTMKSVIDPQLWIPDAKQTLDTLPQHPTLYGKHTFPHETRKKIYEYVIQTTREISPRIPIALCNETPQMWSALQPFLTGMTPSNYACCCGPTSVPGHPLL